jgi:large subunit ribosomal protein L18
MIKRTDSREMRQRRHRRIRMKLLGTTIQPRVSVFRSSVHIYAQIVDDSTSSTLVQASSLDKDIAAVVPALPTAAPADKAAEKAAKTDAGKGGKAADKGGKQAKDAKAESKSAAPAATSKKTLLAQQVGTLLATRAQEKGIKQVVFDRGGYKYHGRVKALADSARAAGLEF